jgi:hypothetical protein
MKSTKGIIAHRGEIDRSISTLPNVLASSIGLKKTDGNITDIRCLKVFVRDKNNDLDQSKIIPVTITKGRFEIPTDDVELKKFRLESDPLVIRSGDTTQGILTCFAKTNGTYYGISCDHVIAGEDGIINAKDILRFWHENNWHEIGIGHQGYTTKGNGELPDFGVMDSGLIKINSSWLIEKLKSCKLLSYYNMKNEKSIFSLIGTRVTGNSFTGEVLNGLVTGVLQRPYDDRDSHSFYSDIVIESEDNSGLTLKGDSGLLWKDQNGKAIAMHIGGYNQNEETNRSSTAVGCFICRLVSHFNITLLDSSGK